MNTRKTLDAVEAAALDGGTAVEWFRRLCWDLSSGSDDETEHLQKCVRDATDLLVRSTRELSRLLDDDDTQTAVRSADSEPVTLAGKTADSVAEVVETLAYDRLRTIAREADRLLNRRSAIRPELLFTLSADKVVAKWDAVREAVSKAPEIDGNALAVAVRKERQRAERVAISTEPDQDDDGKPIPPAEPKAYLWNWKEILNAVGMTDSTENRRQVRRLNDKFDGPIIVTKTGSRPRVDKVKLLAWWNRLDDLHIELQQEARDRQATAAGQYSYGSGGTVVPEIAGSLKKRRKDAKRQAT